MTIRRMVYVACDICGDPAGDSSCMGDDAREARSRAKSVGFRRVRTPEGNWQDICHRHKEVLS